MKAKRLIWRLALIGVLSLAVTQAGCSGGGGGGGFSDNRPPAAAFTADPAMGDPPLRVAFDASASTDPDGLIVSYAWSFGDGSPGEAGAQVSHTYQVAGSFTATLTVRDDDGASNSASRLIQVGQQAPVASFTATPDAGLVPLAVRLDASASTDPDGIIVQYDWDFADGNAATGEVVEHRYDTAGTYLIELTVTDDAGATGMTTRTITARPVTSVTRFEITELPSLPNRQTVPKAINGPGDVAGMGQVDAAGTMHAFVYAGRALIDLGTLGGRNSSAGDLNDAGQVVGWSELIDGRVRAFVFENGFMQDLGTLGGIYSEATSINTAGVIVGTSDNAQGAERAFRYANGVMEDLGTLGGEVSRAWAINSLGQIVGDSWTAITEEHAFLYSNGAMEDIGTLGGSQAFASDINDIGQVVGISSTANAGLTGFIYERGVMAPLGALAGQGSEPSAINNHGQVVGYSDARGFLWDKVNGIRDLNAMVGPTPGWVIVDALAINDSGQIVCVGFDATNLDYPLLLTPAE